LKRPDVVIVGAGSAGCVTARRCAELGLRTLLLDRKDKASIGDKVCGDEISRSHFDATGIDYPTDEEVSTSISGADVYPPDMENILQVRGWTEFDGWTVDRPSFGQRLLEDAIKAGVHFEEQVHVGQPILRDEQVIGVEYRELNSGEEKRVVSKLVVDASGFASVVRNKIDSDLVEKSIDKRDVALCYREILNLKMPLAEPEVARVFLGGDIAPKGYAWVFPKGTQQVNVGIGITGGEGRGSPKSLLELFKKTYPLLFGSSPVDSRGGAVPVRRPLKSLVAHGVAFVGDSALQVNPIHGGGIGAGMRAGIILGEVAREAIARRNLTASGLWSYNTRYLSTFGRRLASLEVFRRLLQAVSDDDLNFGFERKLLEAGDLMAANRGEGFSLSMLNKLKRVKRGAGRLSLLLSLQKASSLMKKIDKAYSSYPTSPEGLEKWNEEVVNLVSSASFERG
jgi:digeranylgeranylglycerophospholipid reductase